MKSKLTFQQRFKKYFTDKPKSNFWMWAFITLFLFKYVAPLSLIILIPFQVGLLTPDTQVNYQSISTNVANGIVKPMEILNKLGSDLGHSNPIISKVLFYALSNFIWVIWVMAITLIINLSRYGISWVYRKSKLHAKQKNIKYE